jgi:hypothetical protein
MSGLIGNWLNGENAQMGLGLLSQNDGRSNSFGRGLQQGQMNVQQMQAKKLAEQKRLAQQQWMQENKPGLMNAPQGYKDQAYKADFATPKAPSAFDEKLNFFKQGNPNATESQLQNLMFPPKERDIVKGADDVNYYRNGARVLPNVKLPPPEANKEEAKLRKEFIGLTGSYRDQQRAFGRIKASAKNPSAAGDLSLIFNYMKVLDPASVVRESEFATAAETGAFGERIKAQVGRVTRGERLSDEMRADFVSRAQALYSEATKGYNVNRDVYKKLANRVGFAPENVVPFESLYGPKDAWSVKEIK